MRGRLGGGGWGLARSAAFLCLLNLLLFFGSVGSITAQTASTTPIPPPPPRDSAPATGVIQGTVVGDDGQPLADAQVSISSARSGSSFGSTKWNTTQADGKFRFTGLRNGAYKLTAESSGYTMPDVEDPSGTTAHYRVGSNVTLTLMKGGVITGSITDVTGGPMIAAPVRAVRVRDSLGRKPPMSFVFSNWRTDDRGVYRIYGLPAGAYVVSAGSIATPDTFTGFGSTIDGVPVYYPSTSSVEGATEVQVNYGQESEGIDIRVRGELGHSITGTLSGAIRSPEGKAYGVGVSLSKVSNGIGQATAYVNERNGGMTFAFSDVPDGEYELRADAFVQEGGANSPPLRVRLKGADLSGLQLVLTRAATIAGRVVLETLPATNNAPECAADGRAATVEELALRFRAYASGKPAEVDVRGSQLETAPNDEGKFTIMGLRPATFWLRLNLPDARQYWRSLSRTGPGGKPVDAGRAGLSLGAGENLTGLTITVAEGAAAVKGSIASTEGKPLPPRSLVHLIPAEPAAAADLLRFFETEVGSDGAFAFANLAPGKYFVYAEPVPVTETRELFRRPVAWDTAARMKLRRAAEAANVMLELKPCQRLTDYVFTGKPNAAALPPR